MFSHVWERCDDLLFRRKVCALLELEVSNGSAKRKIAIDSTKVYEAACCAYSRFLSFILRLMIEG